MHEQHQLLREAEVSFAVMGRDCQFALFELTAPEPPDKELITAEVAKGYAYCGVVGFTGGMVLTCHEPDRDSWLTTIHAARAVARIIAERLEARSPSLAWLKALHELQDTR